MSTLNNRALHPTYLKLKEDKLLMFQATNKMMEEVIKLDVERSFYLYEDAKQEAIKNVLRCYAIHNIEIEYCQGMNFLAGMFYLTAGSEPAAFSMLTTLISALKLGDLYKQDVPLLRRHFHQMNRLLAIYIPRLHVHLFEEGLNAAFLCSAWFLTGFTFVLQYTKTKTIPPLLSAIFDHFILVLATNLPIGWT